MRQMSLNYLDQTNEYGDKNSNMNELLHNEQERYGLMFEARVQSPTTCGTLQSV